MYALIGHLIVRGQVALVRELIPEQMATTTADQQGAAPGAEKLLVLPAATDRTGGGFVRICHIRHFSHPALDHDLDRFWLFSSTRLVEANGPDLARLVSRSTARFQSSLTFSISPD